MKIIVSKLSSDEWQKYRDIRLAALKDDPLAFGSSYYEELHMSETDWRNRIDAMWFATIDDNIVGLIGLLQRENLASKHCGYVISLWVKPEFRGRGVAKELIQKLKDIAPSLGIRKLSLQVTATQTAAKTIYENMGFVKVGLLKENLMKDGHYLDEYLMEWLHDNS